MTDAYDYWRKALAGEAPPIHDGDPQSGYYRKRNKPRDGQPVADDPVAIFEHDGALIALVGEKSTCRQVSASDIWTWIADKPVSYDEYVAAFEQGAWAKAIEGLAPTGHNNPPADDFEALSEQVNSAVQLADQALSEDTDSKDKADRLANIKDRLLQLFKLADEKRAEEKKPHDDAAKAVQAKWKPVLTAADDAKKKVLARINMWIRAEEERIAKEQFEAAKQAEAAGETIPVQSAAPVQVGGAVSGRKTSVRTRKVATITDPVAFATFLLSGQQPNPDVMAALQRCANRIAVSGATADGIEITIQKQAA